MTAPRKSPLRDKTLPALVISVLFILFFAVMAANPHQHKAASGGTTEARDMARLDAPPTKTKSHIRTVRHYTIKDCANGVHAYGPWHGEESFYYQLYGWEWRVCPICKASEERKPNHQPTPK